MAADFAENGRWSSLQPNSTVVTTQVAMVLGDNDRDVKAAQRYQNSLVIICPCNNKTTELDSLPNDILIISNEALE